MANSPLSDTSQKKKSNAQAEYFRQLKRVDDLINHGGSLSGNEPNCAFLNLGPTLNGQLSFATFSHVSVIDFSDDLNGRILFEFASFEVEGNES